MRGVPPEVRVQGPCRGFRRPGPSRVWVPCAAPLVWREGTRLQYRGRCFSGPFPAQRPALRPTPRGPKCEGGGAQLVKRGPGAQAPPEQDSECV